MGTFGSLALAQLHPALPSNVMCLVAGKNITLLGKLACIGKKFLAEPSSQSSSAAE